LSGVSAAEVRKLDKHQTFRPWGDLGKIALMVAHPGHELMVYHWMEKYRPIYFCLTDGSGGNAQSRLASTAGLLDKVGVRPGPLFGRYADKQVYQLLLDGRVEVFVELARELADQWVAGDIDCVSGDAVEGFNPVHDVCRFVVDGAAALAGARMGKSLQNFDFVLDGPPDACPPDVQGEARGVRLDEAALDRKLDAATEYKEMTYEIRATVLRFGRAAFAQECLRPVTTAAMLRQFETELPVYERYGNIRVNQGLYHDVIRYHQHVLPVRQAIEEEVRR
jgi:hypothetical protein